MLSGLVFSMTSYAAEANPPLVASTCVGCHGTGGSSVGPATPTIAGISADTFVEAMQAYQKDERPSTIMGRIAKGYTEKELKVMADYFSQQNFVRYAQEVDAEKVKRGAKLHDEYCEKCHEEQGYVDEDGSAILAGQWLPYLQFSLADFHGGERDMSKKMRKRMEKMVKKQGEGSLEDIAHFYASQNKQP
jgi:sulfide dehydrogenase cytochrome subunit